MSGEGSFIRNPPQGLSNCYFIRTEGTKEFFKVRIDKKMQQTSSGLAIL